MYENVWALLSVPQQGVVFLQVNTYAKLAWIRGHSCVLIGPLYSHVILFPYLWLAAVFYPPSDKRKLALLLEKKYKKKNGGSFFPTKIEVIRGHSRGWFDEANWDKNVPENSGWQLSKSIAE